MNDDPGKAAYFPAIMPDQAPRVPSLRSVELTGRCVHTGVPMKAAAWATATRAIKSDRNLLMLFYWRGCLLRAAAVAASLGRREEVMGDDDVLLFVRRILMASSQWK